MKFKMNRRAVSPVVAAILMTVLTMAAIGISLVYMLPNISKFKDKSYNNSNNLYFVALDSMIQDLINNPPPISRNFYFAQETGQLLLDSEWLVLFIISDTSGSINQLVMQDNVTRIVQRSTAVADYDKGEHRYLLGPEEQDYLFINGSSTLYNEISILNGSRTSFEESYLDLSLYYRYVLDTNYIQSGNTEFYNLDIIHVNLVLNETSIESSTQKNIALQLSYLGSRKESLESISFTTDVTGEIRLLDQYGYYQYEYPIFYPVNPSFISHIINVNMIKIDVSISFT
ncbi:MAG: hypothetical protein KAS63_03000 [Candidatus Heimdallarchaeota archaeon]|nr:hypothetical protein [Candidatus Heimdallarchaeota archaeon]MCK4954304.1 hypothetical protein [Candidatus Heimdallarchaeota archaeon]